jgi:hypothetical protein
MEFLDKIFKINQAITSFKRKCRQNSNVYKEKPLLKSSSIMRSTSL